MFYIQLVFLLVLHNDSYILTFKPTPSTEPPLLWGDCFLEISCLGAQGRPINFVFDDDFELRFAITEYTLIE